MSELRYSDWQKPYEDALSETDKQKLQEKVFEAEWKIYQRMQTISSNGDDPEERSAIAEALEGLLALKIDRLDYPDWIDRDGGMTSKSDSCQNEDAN